jgi:cytochrome b pre-mRNA-processing protein 6
LLSINLLSNNSQSLNPGSVQIRLAHILKHWPSDAVRPASVSVQNYLQSRIALPKNEPTQSSTPETTPAPKAEISASSVNALSALLENRFARAYPITEKIRYPASDPEYFDNLIREFDEAPNRDWFGRLKKRLGGILRLQ